HWMDAGYALFAGGGLKTGQVVGETDSRAERPKRRGVSAQNIIATLYHLLGINPCLAVADFNGRPQYLLDEREPIHELLERRRRRAGCRKRPENIALSAARRSRGAYATPARLS